MVDSIDYKHPGTQHPDRNPNLGILSAVTPLVGFLVLFLLLANILHGNIENPSIDTVYQIVLFGFPSLGTILGITAVITRRGRNWGIVGIITNALLLALFLGIGEAIYRGTPTGH